MLFLECDVILSKKSILQLASSSLAASFSLAGPSSCLLQFVARLVVGFVITVK